MGTVLATAVAILEGGTFIVGQGSSIVKLDTFIVKLDTSTAVEDTMFDHRHEHSINGLKHQLVS